MRTRLVATLSSLALTAATTVTLGALGAPAEAATQVIPVPTSASGLGRIVASPDGSVWFAETDANKVGKILPNGTVQEFPFPAEFPGTTQLKDLDVAPDGSVWVVYESGERVRHMSATGATIVDGSIGTYPYGEQVRVDPSGAAWVTMSYDEDYVIKIVGSSYSAPPNAPECQDALGEAADGSMWCRTSSGLTHLNADANGGVTYPANNFAAYPYAIAAGPVGSIWFGRYSSGTFATSPSSGEVGYLDAATAAVTAFDTGSRTAPSDLVQGPDGSMWFTSIGAAKGIGHIAANGKSGALHQIGGYAPNSLTFGTDGNVYAADAANNVVLRVSTSELQTTNVDPGEGSVFTATATAKVAKRPVTLRRGTVPVKLACPATATAGCTGKARLVTKAKKKPKAVSRTVTYKLAAGKKKSLSIKLSARGLKAVPRHGAATFKLQLLAAGSKDPVSVTSVKVRR